MWTSPPSYQWGPRPAERSSGTSITRCIKLGDCPGLCCVGWNGQVNWQGMWCPLKNCLRQKEDKLPRGWREPELADTSPRWSKTPQRGRGTLAKNELAKVREAHQRALATTIALEEKIERLSQSFTRGWLDACAHSWSHNRQRRRSSGQSRRHCRALLEDSPTHSPAHSPHHWEDKEAEWPFLEFNLGVPPELGLDVKHFFGKSANESREDGGSNFPSEPPAQEYERWVEWRGQVVNMPSWWWELGKIPEEGNFQELAQKIQASFELPQQMSKMHDVENYYLAPLAPKCLCQKDFLSLPDPMFPCWDIRVEQLENLV